MFLAAINKPRQLVYICFAGDVGVAELERGRKDLDQLMADLPAGFRLLTDMSRLESIDIACAKEIGGFMELCEQKSIGLVVRVIPDPAKDIGMNMLSIFHYRRHPRTVTCQTLAEAAQRLEL